MSRDRPLCESPVARRTRRAGCATCGVRVRGATRSHAAAWLVPETGPDTQQVGGAGTSFDLWMSRRGTASTREIPTGEVDRAGPPRGDRPSPACARRAASGSNSASRWAGHPPGPRPRPRRRQASLLVGERDAHQIGSVRPTALAAPRAGHPGPAGTARTARRWRGSGRHHPPHQKQKVQAGVDGRQPHQQRRARKYHPRAWAGTGVAAPSTSRWRAIARGRRWAARRPPDAAFTPAPGRARQVHQDALGIRAGPTLRVGVRRHDHAVGQRRQRDRLEVVGQDVSRPSINATARAALRQASCPRGDTPSARCGDRRVSRATATM